MKISEILNESQINQDLQKAFKKHCAPKEMWSECLTDWTVLRVEGTLEKFKADFEAKNPKGAKVDVSIDATIGITEYEFNIVAKIGSKTIMKGLKGQEQMTPKQQLKTADQIAFAVTDQINSIVQDKLWNVYFPNGPESK